MKRLLQVLASRPIVAGLVIAASCVAGPVIAWASSPVQVVTTTFTPTGPVDTPISATNPLAVTSTGGTTTVGGGTVTAVGVQPSGQATLGNPVLIGGSNGTNTYTLSVDTSGRLQTNTTAINGNTVIQNGNGVQVVSPCDANGVHCMTFTNQGDAIAGSTSGLVNFPYIYNGATFDRRRSGTATAAPFTGQAGAVPMIYNGTTLDAAINATQAQGQSTGKGITAAGLLTWSGSSYQLVISGSDNADGQANTGLNTEISSVDRNQLFNGTTWDRVREVGTGNSGIGTARVSYPLSDWRLSSAPAINTQATATQAAGAAGVKHCATSVSASAGAGTSAPSAATATAYLRDGGTGAGPILWAQTLDFQATAGTEGIVNQNFGSPICGSAATAMTIEFNVAGGANTWESVSANGYDTQ